MTTQPPIPVTFTVIAGPPGSPKTMTEWLPADRLEKYGVKA